MTTHSPDYVFRFRDCLLGAQTLFIAFGALVLVPLLTGMDPSVALFTAGTGTLIFQAVTKGRIPIFLGSSFAFVPATVYGIQTWGLPETLCGLAAGGCAYFLLAALVKIKGQKIVDRMLPAIVTGPVIICIGLILSPAAIQMAMGQNVDGSQSLFSEPLALTIAFVSMLATMLTRLFVKGKLKLVPILVGALTGYALCLGLGMVDFSPIQEANWLRIPAFVTPSWNWQAILLIMPIAFISAIEHVGDIMAISAITGRKFIQSPGLHRSLFGDGLATTWAALMGGPPNTTYAEVTAGVALTKIYNPAIMTWASITAILISFVGKFGAALQTIPIPVMGGILVLLFGAIAVTGMHILVHSQADLMKPRSMTIVGIVLVTSIGGLSIGSGDFAISGIGLGGLAGVILHLLLPDPEQSAAS